MAKYQNDWKSISSILRDWYGGKRANLEMLEFLPKESKVGDAIKHVMDRYVDKNLSTIIKIKNSWDEIAGTQIAAISRPYRLCEKTLVVEIKHPVWMQELKRNGMDKLLIDKINTLINAETCNEIAFVPFGRQ